MNKVSRKINVRTHNSVFYKDKIVGRENIIPRLDEDFRHFCRKSPRAYVDTARRRYFDKTVKEAQPGTIALLLLCTELFIDPLRIPYNNEYFDFIALFARLRAKT